MHKFKIAHVLESVLKFLAILLCPTWDVDHPFVQRIHTAYATCLLDI